jgi:FMN phosphatase YigB (HAD superfamily)
LLARSSIQMIFFDLDGTLRHNLPSGGEVFANYAAQLGLNLSTEDRLRALRWEYSYWANSDDLKADRQIYPQQQRDFWSHYSRRQLIALGASRVQTEELAPKVTDYMEATYHPESVVPDEVKRTLSMLQRAGYRMAVISNREHPYQEEIESLGLSQYLAFSVAGGEIKAWKPDPDIFIHACLRAQVTPSQAVYVGDNYFADVIGSSRAGLQPVLYDPGGLFPEASCPVLTSFEQLPDVLKKLSNNL